MAYTTSSPPQLLMQGIGGVGKVWYYATTDNTTVVDVANYFTNGGSLGMGLGDTLITTETDNSYAAQIMTVNATGDGTTDTNNGVAVTATDSR